MYKTYVCTNFLSGFFENKTYIKLKNTYVKKNRINLPF